MNENHWISRWSSDELKVLLREQFDVFWDRDTGIERKQLAAMMQAAEAPHAVVISGLRRVGKSTLLAQLAHRLGQDRFYYVNFEDERFLGFGAEDANDLYERLVESFGQRGIFLIDEIQNVPGWERFVRRFVDQGMKFFLTGSNAALLSRELGSHLTGRYLPIELFPFSFAEFLRLEKQDVPRVPSASTVDAATLRGQLDRYIRLGGLPEPLKYPELSLARTLYDDVIHRDIAVRYRVTDVMAFKELAYHLMSQPAGLVSFNKLKEQLRLGSVNTVKDYVEHLRDSWLIFTTNVYDFSVKRQQVAPKKVYAIDTGLVNAVGFSFSPNTGRLLENVVFLALRRRTPEIYHHISPTNLEVDFFLPATRQLIQVTQHLEQAGTREREVRALADAMRRLEIESGLILTDRSADPIRIDNRVIEVQSVAEWLLAE